MALRTGNCAAGEEPVFTVTWKGTEEGCEWPESVIKESDN